MTGLAGDGTVESVSPDQHLRRERGQGETDGTCLANHEKDWQTDPVDAHSGMKSDDLILTIGRGGGFDDSVPGDVTRIVPRGDKTTRSPIWSASLVRIELLSQGGGQICPWEGIFSCCPLPKRGNIFNTPPPSSPFVERLDPT